MKSVLDNFFLGAVKAAKLAEQVDKHFANELTETVIVLERK